MKRMKTGMDVESENDGMDLQRCYLNSGAETGIVSVSVLPYLGPVAMTIL